jgi:hypothetical protein
LKAYTSYVNNYRRAIKTLYELRKTNEDFNIFVKEKEKGTHALTTYLIMPIQRVPRYELLVNVCGISSPRYLVSFLLPSLVLLPFFFLCVLILFLPVTSQELRKKTDKNHKDYNNLVAASTKIHQVAEFIDLQKKQAESIAKLFEIQTSMPKLSIVGFLSSSSSSSSSASS